MDLKISDGLKINPIDRKLIEWIVNQLGFKDP